ncbi:MAG: hypothetical protein IIW86_02850 [Clostridia bacterium]|nr:hypothetical protein [Clostridia bacterium]MBQ5900780.1 hypothetical protein [Clostridia bacterium]
MQAYTGQDIIKVDGRVLTALADGNCAVISYPNDLHGMRNGKNKNALAAHNEQGNQAELLLRVIKGSPDDKFLNSKVIAWRNHSDDFAPSEAELTKVIKVDGGTTNEITTLGFMFPTRDVETRTNTDGETDQEVAVYNFRAGTHERALA